MDQMDPKRYCTKRLFREHCSFVNGVFVKNMAEIGRNYGDAMIIDNSPTSYMLQPEQGLPILSWYDDMSDRALYEYIPMLIELSKVKDVRECITNFVHNNTINMALAIQVCKQVKDHDDKQRNKKELADRTASQMKQSYSSPNGVANGNQAGAPSAQDGISGKVTDEAQVKVVKDSQTQPNTQAASQAEINAQKKKPLINGWIIKNPFTSKDEA